MAFNIRSCPHPIALRVHDIATDTIVCSDCALVLDDSYYFSSSKIKYYDVAELPDMKIVSAALQFCANLNIPSSFATRAALNVEEMKKYLHCVRMQRANTEDLLACALYNVGKKYSCFRTLDEIQASTGCSRKKLWTLECLFGESTDPADYGGLIEKYCYFLSLPFCSMKMIREIAIQYIGSLERKPQAIIGACILLRCREENRAVTVRDIAEVVSVSPSVIKHTCDVIVVYISKKKIKSL